MKCNFAILVPFYNEQQTIYPVSVKFIETGLPIIFVNDGGDDMSYPILYDVVTKLKVPNVSIINYSLNRGKGFAIKTGAEEIINKGYDYILVMDADGQTSINDIPQFLTALKMRPGAKIIIGNRLHNPKDMSFIRLLTNKFMSWIVTILTGTKIPDSQCGMRLIHKSVFDLPSEEDKFGYETEQLLQAGLQGFEIVSVPIKCIYYKERKSKINPIKDTFRFFKMILKFIMEGK